MNLPTRPTKCGRGGLNSRVFSRHPLRPCIPIAMKLTTFLIAVSIPALAGDWPQWRGPNRDDSSTETGLLKQWPGPGPKRAWLYENAGQGYSGFSVVAGRL